MTQLPGLPCGMPVLGPVEPWTPSRAIGPTEDSGGHDATPDPSCPPATITVPCPKCKGGGTYLLDGPSADPVETQCRRCDGKPGGTAEVFWRTSARDEQTHMFYLVGDVAEGICQHTIPLAALLDRSAHRACLRCTTLLGELLSLPTHDQPWRAPMTT